MKKIINIIIISISLFLMSCGEEFLTKNPLGLENDQTFYTSEDAALKSLTAAYDPLGWEKYYRMGMTVFGDIASDDSRAGGDCSGTDFPAAQNIDRFTLNARNTSVLDIWNTIYKGIYYCNIVTYKVPSIEFETAENPKGYNYKERIIAEAKYMRAFYFFDLVKLFGGVPVFSEPLTPSEYTQPRATIEEVYAQIEKDLKEAIPFLPEKNQYPDEDLGRATKGAAKSLLVKAYIFQGKTDKASEKWVSAKALAKEVINSGQYSLDEGTYTSPWGEEIPAYLNQFLLNGEHGSGSIFEVNFSNLQLGGYSHEDNEGNTGIIYQNSRGTNNSGWGWGFNCPTNELLTEFEDGDPRMPCTIVFDSSIIAGELITNECSPTKMQNRKMHRTTIEKAPSATEAPDNVRVMRYADLILFYAEACYYTSDEQGARDAVNQIRKRARNGNNGVLPDIDSSGDQLLKDIWHERRVELALEGHRFFDLVRTERAKSSLLGEDFQEGKNELFPIPEVEIQLSNGTMIQNPNY